MGILLICLYISIILWLGYQLSKYFTVTSDKPDGIYSEPKVTRVEVIDENGRSYTKWNCSVELSYQDGGRTLKLFLKPKSKEDGK